MKCAALGIRMHSGWGVVIAVSHTAGKLDVAERTRINVVDPQAPGAKQPFHFAEKLEFAKAERFLAHHSAATERMAAAAIGQLICDLRKRDYHVVAAAVVLASGRALPAMSKILASHALIHAAEGECFRQAIQKACELNHIPVIGIRERDVEEQLRTTFGKRAPHISQEISAAGRLLGPPWTQDHKAAAAAALLALAPELSRPSQMQAGAI
jgi:hypothetical protein